MHDDGATGTALTVRETQDRHRRFIGRATAHQAKACLDRASGIRKVETARAQLQAGNSLRVVEIEARGPSMVRPEVAAQASVGIEKDHTLCFEDPTARRRGTD
jgi:hypothetical protein